MSSAKSLSELLEYAATTNPNAGIVFYPSKDSKELRITYANLFRKSRSKACFLGGIPGISKKKIVLLHFDNHQQNILWFWATVLAGYLPAISTPFSNTPVQHQKHLAHLKNLLDDPVVLTQEELLETFSGAVKLDVHAVESLLPSVASTSAQVPIDRPSKSQNVAALMLTSGSTGNAKAVALESGQILKALEGKAACHGTTRSDVFLNWIGLDHVAGLVEVHLLAMLHGAEQIHVPSSELIAKPLAFIEVIDRFRVSFSFAPNFFLATLDRALATASHKIHPDLSCLRVITSGGEANTIGTAIRLLDSLEKYGVRRDVVVPGFGMTETCAGSIHNERFPEFDLSKGLEFASLGRCHSGMTMRIRRTDGSLAMPGEAGGLELSGPIVFKEYYNDPSSTASVFTEDGWFMTGDIAIQDDEGMLRLVGRAKDNVIINGVKHNTDDIEAAIEEASVAGLAPSYTKVFAIRPQDCPTEGLAVVYLPTYASTDDQARFHASTDIGKLVQIQCGSRPLKIIPLPTSELEKSSLGKLSRAKLREKYESGDYGSFEAWNDAILERLRKSSFKPPSSEIEKVICDAVAEVMELKPDDIGVSSGLLEMGVSSVEVIKFKQILQTKTGTSDIPMITILMNRTIEELASAVQELAKPKAYNPVVVLNDKGSNTPLWLVHPGAGEILVYLNMAKYITDRPVYALRARGFEGEDYFGSISEAIETYLQHVKRVQPQGPYAFLGYSFGSMFAVEMTKALICGGDEVKFTAVLNLPPHIKQRIRQLNMVTAILTLALFLGLVEDDDPENFHPDIGSMAQEELLDEVLRRAPAGRLEEVAMTRAKFLRWAQLSMALHDIAWDYEPSGKVPSVDVFVAHPLKAVARNKEEWFSEQLIKWRDFSASPPRFHHVDGEHFSMIGAAHIATFQKHLKAAMQARGI